MNGKPVYENAFAPWTEDDLFPEITTYELNLAGYKEIPLTEEVEAWLMSLIETTAPLLFLVEQACHDGELLDRQLRATRLSKFPFQWAQSCEEVISAVPDDYAPELFFLIYWSVRIERARRRGHPNEPSPGSV